MLEIDLSSPEPIYEQIISQLGLAILKGDLQEGDKLPPIRQLASDLEINPNTVAKAYQILEESKVVVGRGRSGSIIQANSKDFLEQWLKDIAKEELKNVWSKVLSLGPDKKTARKIWEQSLKELKNES